ncbi:MAG: GNAT family N-acetyltransferase [Dermatophilus congolensis]|nr:GNAT family N-acetyltransferase [Dermatophilus congolensis]
MTDAVTLTEVKRLDAATADVLARIHEESAVAAYAHIFDTPIPREESRERWQSYGGHVVLAQSQVETVGFVAWHGDRLDALYVLPSAAKRGVGSALIAAATGAIRLWVLEENSQARKFYTDHGWRQSGKTPTVYTGTREVEYVRD